MREEAKFASLILFLYKLAILQSFNNKPKTYRINTLFISFFLKKIKPTNHIKIDFRPLSKHQIKWIYNTIYSFD